MRTRILRFNRWYAIAAIISAAVPLGAATPQSAKEPATAQEVIARHIDASGGETALRAIRHRHIVARVEHSAAFAGTPAQGMTSEIETFYLAPDRILMRTSSPGLGKQELGFDGKVGWSVSDLGGSAILPHPQVETLKRMRPEHDQYRLVRDLLLLGEREFEGRSTIAISFTLDSVGRVVEHFDRTTGLKLAMQMPSSTGQGTSEVLFGDYRKTDGFVLPMTTTIRVGEKMQSVVRSVSVSHAPIDANLFVPPPSIVALMKESKP